MGEQLNTVVAMPQHEGLYPFTGDFEYVQAWGTL
jgi:hypothetical protein